MQKAIHHRSGKKSIHHRGLKPEKPKTKNRISISVVCTFSSLANINNFPGSSREWVGAKFVYVLPLSWGNKETHKQHSQEISGKCLDSPGILRGESLETGKSTLWTNAGQDCKLSENFERHWSIRISGEIHIGHTFSWGNSYGSTVLNVLLKFPPTLVLVHGWLFPVKVLFVCVFFFGGGLFPALKEKMPESGMSTIANREESTSPEEDEQEEGEPASSYWDRQPSF